MSKFSGKCDLYDWLYDIAGNADETPYETYKRLNTELYLNEGMKAIIIRKPSDLVPYYPYYDAVHCYERDVSDRHWLCPPQRGNSELDWMMRDALQDEYTTVMEMEDPKYVQAL